jgi:hypothetical protein
MMRNVNLIFLLKNFLGENFKVLLNDHKKTLSKPNIFYLLLDFLDSDTMYELKYVNKAFWKLIHSNTKYENAVLKIELEKMKSLMKGEIEFMYRKQIRVVEKSNKNIYSSIMQVLLFQVRLMR